MLAAAAIDDKVDEVGSTGQRSGVGADAGTGTGNWLEDTRGSLRLEREEVEDEMGALVFGRSGADEVGARAEKGVRTHWDERDGDDVLSHEMSSSGCNSGDPSRFLNGRVQVKGMHQDATCCAVLCRTLA